MLLCELINKIETIKISDENILSSDIKGICLNSKEAKKGELFVAVKGFKSNGHDFIQDAVKKGISCVICESAPTINIPFIVVKDSRIALALISAAWFGYPSEKMKIIGVTGTNGKTSCTYLLKNIIEKSTDDKVGLIGTVGNMIGQRVIATQLTTPDSYELQSIFAKMLMEGCRYVVMEVSSHALSQSRVYGTVFDIGIFTNLSPEHLDFHETMEEYAKAKSVLFKNCKHSIINIDDKYSALMTQSSPGEITTYAVENEKADFLGKDIKLYPNKVEYTLVSTGTYNLIKVHIPGLFTVYNSLASIAAANQLGLDEESIVNSLSECQGIRGRAEVLGVGSEFTIIVDYAHTPDALSNIIKAARTQNVNRVITLFGCGGDRDKSKRPVMGKIATDMSDYTFITSDNPRTEDPLNIINDITAGINNEDSHSAEEKYTVIKDRKVAIYKAIDMLQANDVLIIAGKGHETYQIIGNDKVYFDDREIVEEYLSEKRKNNRRGARERLKQ